MSNKNLNIQALRGFCAIVVFLSHALHIYNSELIDFLDKTPFRFFYAGEVAVSIFFVLSGFFYYTENKNVKFTSYKKMVIKKIKRIYPAHILFLTIGFILLNIYQKNCLFNDSNTTEWFYSFWKTPVSLIQYIQGCSIILLPDTNLINPPVWYLEAEVKMFIIMPLLVPFLNKRGWWLTLLIILICTIWKIPVFSCVGYYVLGALARKCNDLIYGKINSSHISLFIYLFIAIGLLNVENEVDINNRYTGMISCIGACLLIIVLYNTKIKFFENRIFQFLGSISYEFYLCHFVVLLALSSFFSSFLLIVVSFIISILLAYFSNRIITKIFSGYENKKNNR